MIETGRKVPFLIFLCSSIVLAAVEGDEAASQHLDDQILFEEYVIDQVSRLVPGGAPPGEGRAAQPMKCGTHVLNTLVKNRDRFSPSTIATLSRLGVNFDRAIPALTRPTLDAQFDSGIFRFHFTTSGRDSVDSTDADGDGVPDFINMMALAFEQTYFVEISTYGFVRPPGDDWYGDNGGSGAYDIYVSELGSTLYGYTQMEYMAHNESGDNEFSDVTEKNAYTSYIAMRNNYDGFPYSDEESVQITAAHELFHAIQFGYDGSDAIWMLEASATWAEDEVFDQINENYYYLKNWLKKPYLALNLASASRWYGSWIFFRYLSEHVGGHGTVRKIFERSVDHDSRAGDFSIQTIDEALSTVGSSFGEAFNSMVIANSVLSSDPLAGDYTYEEADAYRDFGIAPHLDRSVVLTDSESIIVYDGGQLMQNATHYINLTAAEGPLEISFVPTNTNTRFQVNGIIVRASGSVSVYEIGANRIVPIPYSAESVIVAVVTDTAEDAIYDYTLQLNPEVPLPSVITLFQNFPNPFNSTTTLRFFLPQVEPVSLSILDLMGRQVGTVHLPDVRRGFNDATFEARHLPSGIYVARLEGETESVVRKLTLIK